MSQNCFWFRTSSSVKKHCALACQKFWIPLQSRQKILGRCFAPSACIHRKNRWVPYWCLYCTKLVPISKTKWGNDFARFACVVAWNWIVRSDSARLVRLPAVAGAKTKNFPSLISDFRRGVWGEPTKNGKEIFGFASPFQSPKRAILFYYFVCSFFRPHGDRGTSSPRLVVTRNSVASFAGGGKSRKRSLTIQNSLRNGEAQICMCLPQTRPCAHKSLPFLGDIIKRRRLLPD